MKEKLLKYENMKLKNQYIFTLPATKSVCGRVCPGCYAIKFQVRFPKTLEYRERMLERSKQDGFVNDIVDELNKSKREYTSVRIHESGEFYSQEYINKWEKIAKQLPNTKFYAFTKRMKDFDFKRIMSLPNVVIIDSMKFNGLNYGPKEDMMKLRAEHGTMICPATISNNKETCGVTCDWCWTKKAQEFGTVFVKH